MVCWFLLMIYMFFLDHITCPNLCFFGGDAIVHGVNNLVLNQYLEDVAAFPQFFGGF